MKGRALQERRQPDSARRRIAVALSLGWFTGLASWPARRAGAVQPAWEVASDRSLVLRPGASFDLSTTLPRTMRRGGTFEVDPVGSPLPAGIRLSRSGVLTVDLVDSGGVEGVVFRYTPPD